MNLNALYRTVLRSLKESNKAILELAQRGRQGKIPYNNPKQWTQQDVLDYFFPPWHDGNPDFSPYDPRTANIRRLRPHVQGIKQEIRNIPLETQKSVDVMPFTDDTYQFGYLGAYNDAWHNPTLRPRIYYDDYEMLHQPGILTHEFMHHSNPEASEEAVRRLTRERLKALKIPGGDKHGL